MGLWALTDRHHGFCPEDVQARSLALLDDRPRAGRRGQDAALKPRIEEGQWSGARPDPGGDVARPRSRHRGGRILGPIPPPELRNQDLHPSRCPPIDSCSTAASCLLAERKLFRGKRNSTGRGSHPPGPARRRLPAGGVHERDRRLGLGEVEPGRPGPGGAGRGGPGPRAHARRGGGRQAGADPRGDPRRPDRGGDGSDRAPGPGRPEADRAHAALQPGDVHGALRSRPQALRGHQGREGPALRRRAVLVQRRRRPLRDVPGRRFRDGRAALLAQRLRAVPGLPRGPLRREDPRDSIPREEHRRRPGPDGRRGPGVLRGRAPGAPSSRRPERGRPGLSAARPAGDRALRRRGAADQARDRAATDPARRHPLRPRRAHDRAPPGRSTGWSDRATPSSSWSTRCAWWRRATGSSTSAPTRGTRAAGSSRPGLPTRWSGRPAAAPRPTWPDSSIEARRRSGDPPSVLSSTIATAPGWPSRPRGRLQRKPLRDVQAEAKVVRQETTGTPHRPDPIL